ncbi:hypothetical protein GGR51DRAFT_478534 [Nemania sp. FL0031]|nr:hypothetical protein GGR51DRAFT_478534 [Nemania sp. FL0031]
MGVLRSPVVPLPALVFFAFAHSLLALAYLYAGVERYSIYWPTLPVGNEPPIAEAMVLFWQDKPVFTALHSHHHRMKRAAARLPAGSRMVRPCSFAELLNLYAASMDVAST